MNAFAVLGLTVDATRMEVERAGQRLLAQLEVGAESARFFGEGAARTERTPEAVRAALTTLRDPDQRIEAELTFLATRVDLAGPEGVTIWEELRLGMTRPLVTK